MTLAYALRVDKSNRYTPPHRPIVLFQNKKALVLLNNRVGLLALVISVKGTIGDRCRVPLTDNN